MTAKFDTLRFAKELESAGMARDVTMRLTSLLHDDVLGSMATKQDLRELEQSLTIRIGGMLTVAVGILVAVQKLL